MTPAEAIAKIDAAITAMGLEQEWGNSARLSQYGEPYLIMINGDMVEEGEVHYGCEHLEQAVDRTIAYFLSLARDADDDFHVESIVWRTKPEVTDREMPARRALDDPRRRWKLYLRFHTRTRHTPMLPCDNGISLNAMVHP